MLRPPAIGTNKTNVNPKMQTRPFATVVWTLSALLLAACGHSPTQPPADAASTVAEAAPQPTACPGGVPAETRCLAGRDSAGAYYLIALPKDWNGHLVLHAHGGPVLGEPRAERVVEDLKRWAITVRAGFAWAGSSFAQGGVAVRAAATDTERLRRIFVRHVALPRRTILHGQSWGAGVAAKGAEMYSAGKPYDAVLLTSGVLGGGTRSYDFRLDLRVLYQHLCHNHPRPDEPQYPLWMGLPADSKMTPAELAIRNRECLGLGLPAAQRTPEQARKLMTIVDIIRIPERNVQGHLNWGTFHFRDIAQRRTGGGNVFGNIGAVYQAADMSAQERATLNAAVLRYAADPDAVRTFGDDTDPSGQIAVPVLSVHAVKDPIAFVELEHEFRRTMQAAGAAHRLVQTFTEDSEHSYLSDPVYPTLLEALLAWVEQGRKPTPQSIAERCEAMKAPFGPGCRFLPGYEPAPLDSRVAPRQRP
jgi:alpha-beta hydrolase superfamily lysophospholipase